VTLLVDLGSSQLEISGKGHIPATTRDNPVLTLVLVRVETCRMAAFCVLCMPLCAHGLGAAGGPSTVS
jgi:hypothetical protein